jgi:3-dehydroquinate synthase II
VENMELWIDDVNSNSGELGNYADRLWRGDAPDVAEIDLSNYKSQEEAISMIGIVPWILIKCKNWKMIPLENLISKSLGSGTKIVVSITDEIDVLGVSFALQHGVDALLLPPIKEIWSRALKVNESKKNIKFLKKEVTSKLSCAKVTSIDSGGFGERVCIDLIERLADGEGMLIGSVSEILCLVHGETIPSEYVPSRPFRVNAGPVHSYVLMADGKTKYLNELEAGNRVAIVNSKGDERSASIGRIKIERRPFLKIAYKYDEILGNLITQQAETVRIVSNLNHIKSVTELVIGDELLVRIDSRMRHIGNPLIGDIREI